MKKIKSVTIGISAFNEEKNIVNILKDILKQKRKNWYLKEVLVYSDGSNDLTVEKAKSLKNKKIIVINDNKRKGKACRIQELFKEAHGDIIVMFDADVRIKSLSVIEILINKFSQKNTMLVGGNTIPYPPNNFFQKSVYSTFQVFYESRLNIKKGKNLFACTGGCLSIRSSFAKTIKFPKIKNEDTYLYFACVSEGFDFDFAKNAVVNYKLAASISDYLSQVFRSNPEAVQLSLSRHFGSLVNKEYDRGRIFYLRNILKVFKKSPIPTLFIIVVNISCRPFFKYKSNNNVRTWDVVATTK